MDPVCERSFIDVNFRYFMVFCGGHPIVRLIVTMCDILHVGRRQPE